MPKVNQVESNTIILLKYGTEEKALWVKVLFNCLGLKGCVALLLLLLRHNFASYYKANVLKTESRGSANIDSVPRAQGKIESNMAYPDMFVQLLYTLCFELEIVAVAEARRHAAGAS